jgi:hypothetical protein
MLPRQVIRHPHRMLRFPPFAVSLLALTALVPGQDEQKELVALRQKKLQSEFLTKVPWLLDFDRAQAKAQQDKKLIFAYFTRSYAPCPFCTAVETGELVDAKFVEFAQGVVPFCHITSQVDGEKYPDLLQQRGGSAYPYFAVLDAHGNLLAPLQGNPTVAGFGRALEAARAMAVRLTGLAEKAGKGDQAAAVELFEQQLLLNHLDAAAAKERLAGLKDLSAEQKAKFTALVARIEVAELTAKVSEEPRSQYECGKAFARMLQEGRIPPDGQEQVYFWYLLSVAGEQDQDAAVLARAVTGIKAMTNAPKNLVDQIEGRLQRVKESAGKGAEPGKEPGKGR